MGYPMSPNSGRSFELREFCGFPPPRIGRSPNIRSGVARYASLNGIFRVPLNNPKSPSRNHWRCAKAIKVADQRCFCAGFAGFCRCPFVATTIAEAMGQSKYSGNRAKIAEFFGTDTESVTRLCPLRRIERGSQRSRKVADQRLGSDGSMVTGDDMDLHVALGQITPTQSRIHDQVRQHLHARAEQCDRHWGRYWLIVLQGSKMGLEHPSLLWLKGAKVKHRSGVSPQP